jgi:GTPase SAR1 family protein
MVICVVGASAVGKTLLLKKLCEQGEDEITEFTKTLSTVGISHYELKEVSTSKKSNKKLEFPIFCRRAQRAGWSPGTKLD